VIHIVALEEPRAHRRVPTRAEARARHLYRNMLVAQARICDFAI
jgi:hypothetical protein